MLIVTAVFLLLGDYGIATAQTLSSRIFDQGSGLTDLDPVDILELPSSVLMVRSQGGTFLFDGKAFLPLGAHQGLTGNTVFKDLVAIPSKNLIVGIQGDRLLVARQPVPFSLQNLHFLQVANTSEEYANFRMVRPFGQGVVVLAGNHIRYVDLTDPSRPHFAALPVEISALEHLPADPLVLGVKDNTVLLSFENGQVCSFAVGKKRCWSHNDGLPADQWGGFVGGPRDQIFFRSGRTFATINLVSGHVRTEPLPDISSALEAYPAVLTLQPLPNGDLVTQSQHGVVIRRQGHWQPLYLYDGNSLLWAMHVDQSGSIWLGLVGQGLVQYFGYGRVLSWNHEVGLLPGITWSETRDKAGNLWIGTDGGLDRLDPQGHLQAVLPQQSIEVVAADPDGENLWVLASQGQLEKINPLTRQRSPVPLTGINTFRVDRRGDVWIATQHGLYRLSHEAPVGTAPVLCSSANLTFTSVVIAEDDSVWLTGSGSLWKFTEKAGLQPIITHWPRAHVELEVLAIRNPTDFWVGSDDGLFRITMGAAEPQVTLISTSKLPSQSINALAVDRKERVWVGTSNGVGVYDGTEWHGLDITNGLIGNDVAQDGIYVDHDDSVWIGTSRGLSHVSDTASTLRVLPIRPVVLSVSANNRFYKGEVLENSNAALTVQVGVNGYPSSTRIIYQFELDQADHAITQTTQNSIVFPSLPSGVHHLQIKAIDPLSAHPPAIMSVPVAVAFPWWEQRWFMALLVCLLVLTLWLLVRLRTAYLLQQKNQLNEAINNRTAELKMANLALEEAHTALTEQSRQLAVQAMHDGLTGLLNRRASQSALTEMLAMDCKTGLTVALIDIDHFKQLNDTHGHLAGDSVLVSLGQRFRAVVQEHEIIGRFGGEEYILVVPLNEEFGLARIEAIIAFVTAQPVEYNGMTIDVAVSAGATVAQREDTWESVIGRADGALYRAKQQGRKRLVVFDGNIPPTFSSAEK